MIPDQITITVPRDLATPLGVLPREDSVHFHSADGGWLSHNIRKRLTEDQRILLRNMLTFNLFIDRSPVNEKDMAALRRAIARRKSPN